MLLLITFLLLSSAHNWIHSRSRAEKASSVQPAPPRPAQFKPHLRVGQGQEFAFEWMTGHPKSKYYFVVLKAEHEDKLKLHTISALEAYVNQAPASAVKWKESKWQKRHMSFKSGGYAKELKASDALYFNRPESWDSAGISQFQYSPSDVAGDKRVSYKNNHWPWIEAVHTFKVSTNKPKEFDLAPFTIEGRDGPGHYMIHMVWRGYRDVIDIDLLSSPSPDIYGSVIGGESSWTKVNHCQFKSYEARASKCYFVDKTTRDISKCMNFCKKKGCAGLNIVPLFNPAEVKVGKPNIPWGRANKQRCDKTLLTGKEDENTLVCYGLQPNLPKRANPDVDTLWTIIDDDPEDPIFYSTCYVQTTEIVFDGFIPNPTEKPHPAPINYKVADMCLPCAAVDGIPQLEEYEVPRWKLTRECKKCS